MDKAVFWPREVFAGAIARYPVIDGKRTLDSVLGGEREPSRA